MNPADTATREGPPGTPASGLSPLEFDELRKGRSASIPNLAPLIEEYLPVDLQLDLSSDSVQVFVEKKLGRYFSLKGEVAMGYVGQQRQEGQRRLGQRDRQSQTHPERAEQERPGISQGRGPTQ